MYFKIEKDIVFYHAITSIKLNNRDIVIKANGETYVFSGKKPKEVLKKLRNF